MFVHMTEPMCTPASTCLSHSLFLCYLIQRVYCELCGLIYPVSMFAFGLREEHRIIKVTNTERKKELRGELNDMRDAPVTM